MSCVAVGCDDPHDIHVRWKYLDGYRAPARHLPRPDGHAGAFTSHPVTYYSDTGCGDSELYPGNVYGKRCWINASREVFPHLGCMAMCGGQLVRTYAEPPMPHERTRAAVAVMLLILLTVFAAFAAYKINPDEARRLATNARLGMRVWYVKTQHEGVFPGRERSYPPDMVDLVELVDDS